MESGIALQGSEVKSLRGGKASINEAYAVVNADHPLRVLLFSSGNFYLESVLDALPGVTLWIDAGFSDVADCAFWLPLGATLVIGSEGATDEETYRRVVGRPWQEVAA